MLSFAVIAPNPLICVVGAGLGIEPKGVIEKCALVESIGGFIGVADTKGAEVMFMVRLPLIGK
jgi:hypothetical protein